MYPEHGMKQGNAYCIYLHLGAHVKRTGCTDDLIVVPKHDTGTVKLRARCFSCPALTGEAMIGKPDSERHYHQRVYPPLPHSPTMGLAEQ
jgi:hypothetical protein